MIGVCVWVWWGFVFDLIVIMILDGYEKVWFVFYFWVKKIMGVI